MKILNWGYRSPTQDPPVVKHDQLEIPIKNGSFWLGKSPILMGDFGAWPQGAQRQVEGCGGEAQRFPHLSAHPMDAEFKW